MIIELYCLKIIIITMIVNTKENLAEYKKRTQIMYL